MNGSITRRAISPSDMEFLRALYATTRADELASVDWTDDQKAAFVLHQFNAQHEHWQNNYTDTSWDLVLRDGVPVGRLYVARWKDEIRIVDIALMPEARNAGIGAQLLSEIFDEADTVGKKVSVHVEIYNPARRLYDRLGFVPAADLGVYLLLERPPMVVR